MTDDHVTPQSGFPPTSPPDPSSPADRSSPADPRRPADPSSPANHTSLQDPSAPHDIVRISLAGLAGLGGTGDSRVDEAVAQLGRLDDAPLADHPAILGEVHDRLRDVLGELSPADSPRASGTP